MFPILTGRFPNLRILTLAMCVAAVALVSAGCDKLPLLAPQSSTIKLSAATTNVQANGTTEIRATVLEASGTPVQNGTTVTFTTNLGTVSPADARTLNGVATVQFLGNGQSGKATLKAISGGAASDPLELSVGAAAAGRVNVSASPTAVPAAGGSTTITAVVVDASGNPIAGVPVTFSTTAGSFSATVVNTDTAGTARTTLTTTAAASVTATAGGSTSTAVSITISARPTVSITVTGTAAEGAVTTFSVTVTPASSGGSPIQDVVVDYGDGTSDTLGSVSGTITLQHVYGDSGSYTPTVTATDTTGTAVKASTAIFVQPMLVTASVTSKTNNGSTTTVNFESTVSPSIAVASYTWSFGDGTSQTTNDSTITHTYPNSPSKTYTVKVTARSSTGHTSSGSTTVKIP